MKCTCPSGGNRECPDDCLYAAYWSAPAPDQKTLRKPTAIRLYEQGYTQAEIARQLHVSQYTISMDLQGLLATNKPPRPKGGRPKGSSSKERRKNERPEAVAAARDIVDGKKTYPETEKETGFSNIVLRAAVAREEGRREAEPIVTRDMLSISAQQKFDAAIRRQKQELAGQFHEAVNERVRERIDEIVLPHWKKQIEQASTLYERRRGLMNKETFNTIRRALHPDSRQSISDHKLGAAFDSFMALEKYLLDEKDSPTELRGVRLPKTWAEWEEAKRKATAARKAKYAASRSAVRR